MTWKLSVALVVALVAVAQCYTCEKTINGFKFCPEKIPIITYQVASGETQGSYWIALCSTLANGEPKSDQMTKCDTTTQQSVCQNASGVFYGMGTVSDSASTLNASSENSFVASLGGGSNEGGCNAARATEIIVVCAKSTTGAVINLTEPGPCKYKFYVSSKYACPSGCGSWSSCWWCFDYGWIIIIVFVLLVITYFILGGVYQFYKNEARGIDIIPNLEFWKALPFLIKDGFIYTIQKVSMGRLCSDYTAI